MFASHLTLKIDISCCIKMLYYVLNYYYSSGVPQGFKLGSLLFSLYINESMSSLRFYADDMKLREYVSSDNDCNTLHEYLKHD